MGGELFSKWIFLILAEIIQILIFNNKNNLIAITWESRNIAIQSYKNIFFKSDGLTLATALQKNLG